MSTTTIGSTPDGLVAPEESGFTAELGRRYAPLFEDFYQHPFVAGLRSGDLDRAKVLHYVGQDHQYLSAYVRCYGLGTAMSPDREWMRYFHEATAFVLDDESHPHHVLCDYAGVGYAEAQVDRLAPSAQAYIDHMMQAGRDSLGVLMASLLPCPWTYTWAADRFVREESPAAGHPFFGWWDFYADRGAESVTDRQRALIDALAEDAGRTERARMERAFEDSCHHEIRFWEMSWTTESWRG